ncbi:MAG: S41 family peptidase [Proteobacteria bacterium]|nr:S41 family peptidase [Pseudomonadota bacterium]
MSNNLAKILSFCHLNNRLKLYLCLGVMVCSTYIFSNRAFAMNCDDLNQNLNLLKQDINFHQLSEDNTAAIMSHFVTSLDPMKHYFLSSDIDQIEEYFGFNTNTAEEIAIDCERIHYIADIFKERMNDMHKHLIDLDFESLNPEHQKLLMRHEPFDFAIGARQLIIRWEKQVMFERLLLTESFKNNQKLNKPELIRRKILDHFRGRDQWLDPQRNDYELYYYFFLQAVLHAFDYFTQVEDIAGARILNQYILDVSEGMLQSLSSSVLSLRNPLEPYWRIVAPISENNPLLLKEDIFLPGDIILAASAGKYDIFRNFAYITHDTEFQKAASSEKNHRKKFLILRPNPKNDSYTILVVSMPLFHLASVDSLAAGNFIVTRHKEDLPSPSESEKPNISESKESLRIGVIKLPFIPPSNDPADPDNATTIKIRNIFGSMDYYLESLLVNLESHQKPDSLVLDFRSYDLVEPSHTDYTAAIKLLSYFLPNDTDLGFIRQKSGPDSEPEDLAIFAMTPAILKDKPQLYEKLQNIPITVLVSSATHTYAEWMANVLRHRRRALVVGDKHTFGKDSILTAFEGKSTVFSLNSLRLFPSHGKSIYETGPLHSDLYVPSPLPEVFPIKALYSEDDENRELVHFEPEPNEESYRDFLPERIFSPLMQTSQKRVESHNDLKRHQYFKDLAATTLNLDPSGVPLHGQKVEYISSPGLEKRTKPHTLLSLSNQFINHDPVLMETLRINYDYYHLLNHGIAPKEGQVLQIIPTPETYEAEKPSKTSGTPFMDKKMDKKTNKKKKPTTKKKRSGGGFFD